MARSGGPQTPPGFERLLRGLVVVGPGLMLAATGLATPLLTLLYGADFAPAGPILAVLAWSAVANWFYAPFAIALQARGKERSWLTALTLALLLNAVVNVWLIPRWAGLGAAAANLVSETALVVVGAIMVRRALGLRVSARPFVGALTAATAGGAALLVLAPLGAPAATLAAVLAYVGVLLPFRVVTSSDLVTVRGWIRQAMGAPS